MKENLKYPKYSKMMDGVKNNPLSKILSRKPKNTYYYMISNCLHKLRNTMKSHAKQI